MELIVDNFAGGGGASSGIEAALGRPVDFAINHDPEAIAMHRVNHPHTVHFCSSVWDVDPARLAAGRPVGLGWFSPDCFPAGTMILTLTGYRPIEEIEAGDLVLTHQQRWRRVTATMQTVKPLVCIRGQGHPGLLVSPEHPFYARQRRDVWRTAPRGYQRTLLDAVWAPADTLERGWYWASPTIYPAADAPPVPIYRTRGMEMTPELLWLAGRYVADGWTRVTETRAELVVTCGRHEADALQAKLQALWPRAGLRAAHDELAWHERETSTAYQFATSHRGLVEWLRQHFGHGAAEKLIPGWLLGLAPIFRESFLDGYLSGDGCVSDGDGTKVTVATTVSKALAFGLKALVNSFGHAASVTLRTTQPDVIEGRKVNVRPAWGVRWRAEIADGHAQSMLADGLLWAPIRERREIICEAAEVFNLSVEEDESYVADGIIVHNCTFHSKARGGKPFRDRNMARRRRGLANLIPRWAATKAAPRVILLENVEEFADWGPLLEDGKICPKRRGMYFRRWHRQLENMGYRIDMREMRACDYGAPTTRKRLFIVMRRDGGEIIFPEATHGEFQGAQPYRTAAECIDWSIPCPSIFERSRPLAEATLRRIARGVMRYVVNNPQPFIVGIDNKSSGPSAAWAGREPLRTVTTENRFAVVAPIIAGCGGRMGQSPERSVARPMQTITTKADACVVTAFLAKHYGGNYTGPGLDMRSPLSTITTVDHHALVTALLIKFYGNEREGCDIGQPLHTITTKDRFGLVMVHGEPHRIVDIGMRMLTPRELYLAQGFRPDYIIDHGKDEHGELIPLTKTAQVRMCGNSVSPSCAEALVRANYVEQRMREVA